MNNRSVESKSEIKLFFVVLKNDNVISLGFDWRPDSKVYLLLYKYMHKQIFSIKLIFKLL